MQTVNNTFLGLYIRYNEECCKVKQVEVAILLLTVSII